MRRFSVALPGPRPFFACRGTLRVAPIGGAEGAVGKSGCVLGARSVGRAPGVGEGRTWLRCGAGAGGSCCGATLRSCPVGPAWELPGRAAWEEEAGSVGLVWRLCVRADWAGGRARSGRCGRTRSHELAGRGRVWVRLGGCGSGRPLVPARWEALGAAGRFGLALASLRVLAGRDGVRSGCWGGCAGWSFVPWGGGRAVWGVVTRAAQVGGAGVSWRVGLRGTSRWGAS